MGVKAVWGRTVSESLICFGARSDNPTNTKAYFTLGRSTAEKAVSQPYLLTIGGGEQVPTDLRGRVLELSKVTGVYGKTNDFVRDSIQRERLAQWPVSVILSEVYSIVAEPGLVEDLGFSDHKILANAFDRVLRDDERIARLWSALKDFEVRRRREVVPPIGFRDPGKVQLVGSMYPTISSTSTEGRKILREMRVLERKSGPAREAKERNRTANNGSIVCEACEFCDPSTSMFDSHHLEPLATGERESCVDDFAVLCPTCHRWAHRKAANVLMPLSIEQVREALRRQ